MRARRRRDCGIAGEFFSLMAIAVAWAIWFGGSPDLQQGSLFQIDDLVWYTRGLSLSAGILLALVLWNQIDDGHAAEAHACLLAILAGTNLVAAASDLVSLFLCVGAGEHSDVRDPLSAAAGSAGTRSRDQILSAQRIFVGTRAVRHELAVRRRRDDESRGDWRMHCRRTPSSKGTACCRSPSPCCWPGCASALPPCRFTFTPRTCFRARPRRTRPCFRSCRKSSALSPCCGLLPLTGAGESLATWLPNGSAKLLLAVLAVATMFVGNLMALRQKHLYRLMAYSSVAHAGYMLVGLAVGDGGPIAGTEAVLFYLGGLRPDDDRCLRTLQRGRAVPTGRCEFDDDLRGLNRDHPAVALMLAVCLFSLTGLAAHRRLSGKAQPISGRVVGGKPQSAATWRSSWRSMPRSALVLSAADRRNVSRSGAAA